ncbi:DUF6773 family protein [Methanobacterium ferruginis]|uniref:DUF6773 family protein n=1 Tax=Methanobacterium ferruginis TaxID=710191 RepID=UPI002573B704|nr:DUF6773 family protein [Methanobacterium ferruginis]BDZ67615.1 hypothetical protein GCM10025860_10630 [Methanobacterium ferruginis]
MQRNELDEMQLQTRNKIGNQTFMLLFYLLLISIGMYGFGFRWLDYPLNVFVIMLVCMSYYRIKIMWNNAYLGPVAKNQSVGRKVIYVAAIAGIVLVIAAVSVQSLTTKTAATEDSGAIILFVFFMVLIIVAVLVGIIAKRQNSE